MQFMGFYENDIGSGTVGAKITAEKLNNSLKNDKSIDYKIREINIDPSDPKKQIFIILQKTMGTVDERDFIKFPMIERYFRTGVFDDLDCYKSSRDLWKEEENLKNENGVGINRLTFYD